jgi:DNA invertase Pin-like site-specific DNA recombinase
MSRASASPSKPGAAALIGYARVSTHEQNPDLQLDALDRIGCARIFIEHASGAKTDRPELAAALDFLRAGDTLCVWRLDRLARSLPHLIEVVGQLAERDVGFKSLTESIDTTTAGGRLVFHIFGALAEFERELIRERTQAGLAAARTRGRKGGRRPVLTPSKRKAAAALIAVRDEKGRAVHTYAEIAASLDVSRATIVRHAPDLKAMAEKAHPSGHAGAGAGA